MLLVIEGTVTVRIFHHRAEKLEGVDMDISPDKQNIDQVFANTTYYIDFYQRDYKWTDEPVIRLLDDLFYGFEETYQNKKDLDAKAENVVAHYPWYYLSTYVTNNIDGRESYARKLVTA